MNITIRLILLIVGIFVCSPAYSQTCTGPVGGHEGMCAGDFSLVDLDGKPVRLSDHLGKVIFLNFWATWCEPCLAEMPAMQKANQKLAGKDFVMLTVSIDEGGKPVIESFLKKVFGNESPNFPVLMDPLKTASSIYGTVKVPETFIIDRTGKIVDKVEGIRDWTDSLVLHYLQLLQK